MQKLVLCERPLRITSAVGLYIGALGTLLDQSDLTVVLNEHV